MCGLVGIFAPGAPRLPAPGDLERMVAALVHRGPDEQGFHREPGLGLGHARLSIIDLAGGKQPMGDAEGQVRVVFNGEIFNHVELRAELEALGHRFATRSDTEVLVHGWKAWGFGMLPRLNGQFSIALWDARARKLVLVRDRVGVRPLFHTRLPDGRIAFASEMKALFALPEVPRRLSPRAIAAGLERWAPLDPSTVFEGIESLAPGSWLVIDDHGEATSKRWWDWPFPPEDEVDHARPVESWAEEVRALLIDAVRLRLVRADVPVGAYLSGGLDSSIITSAIRTFSDAPLRSFSLRFEDEAFDEGRYQDELVTSLGTDHTKVLCRRADIARLFPRTIWHTEAPIVRTAPTPMLLLSQAVHRAGYKVVLTGEGADEVFAGYDLFKEAAVRRFWARRPGSTARPKILSRLYPYLASSPTGTPAYAEAFFRKDMERTDDPFYAHRPRWATARRTWRFFAAALREDLATFDVDADLRAQVPAAMARWAPLCRDQWGEGHTLLSSYLLSSQGDRMGMASSVEGRFPFLDARVLELAARIPPSWKLLGLREKFILKKAMGDLLPDVIRRRPKQPYRAPDAASFFDGDGRLVSWAAELLAPERLASTGLFDPAAVRLLVDKCRAGRAIGFGDNMSFVGVLSTMLLDELFVRGTSVDALTPSEEVAAC